MIGLIQFELFKKEQRIAPEEYEYRQEENGAEIGQARDAAGQASARDNDHHSSDSEREFHQIKKHEDSNMTRQDLLPENRECLDCLQVSVVHDGHDKIHEQECQHRERER